MHKLAYSGPHGMSRSLGNLLLMDDKRTPAITAGPNNCVVVEYDCSECEWLMGIQYCRGNCYHIELGAPIGT